MSTLRTRRVGRAGRRGRAPAPRRILGATAAAVAVALLGVGGCSEESPEFRDLASPAEEEAVPLESETLEKEPEARERAEERVGERLEAREAGDEPGDEAAGEGS